jgi:prepilin-type processing-associated H-X9-DG protein
MNATMGLSGGSGLYSTPLWGFKIFKSISSITKPSDYFVTIDEDDNSINDALFRIDYATTVPSFGLNDIPAVYHNKASGVAFADGHAEMHKWRTLKVPVPGWANPANGAGGWGNNNRQDAQWLLEHTGDKQ